MHIRSVTLDIERYPTRDHYPFNLPVFRSRSSIAFTRPVTFFIGENGTGKEEERDEQRDVLPRSVGTK